MLKRRSASVKSRSGSSFSMKRTEAVTDYVFVEPSSRSGAIEGFEDDHGESERAGVGEAQVDSSDAKPGREFGSSAGEMQRGFSAWGAADFEVVPADAEADAGAESLGAGLLGGEAGGEAFSRGFLAPSVGDLGRGEDAFEESVAEALDAALDARDFCEVGSESDDHGNVPFYSSTMPETYRDCRRRKRAIGVARGVWAPMKGLAAICGEGKDKWIPS